MATKHIPATKQRNHEDIAKELGAIRTRLYYVKTPRDWFTEGKACLFSCHFFNENDEEIAYYMEDMKSFGLVKFDTPRIWSDYFKNHENYTTLEHVN